MVWGKLDDAILDHPKMARVGPLGFAYYAAGLVYTNRNLTDGFIPFSAAHRLLPTRWLGAPDEEGKQQVWEVSICSGHGGLDTDEAVEETIKGLVANGLWEQIEDGYLIHDFLDWNPSREQVLAEREKARARMARVRGSGSFARTSPELPANFARSSDAPVPVPIGTLSPNEPPPVQEHSTREESVPRRSPRPRGNGFHPPSVPEVKKWVAEHHPEWTDTRIFDAVKFCAHYDSVGWIVGKKRMVNWHAAAVGWARREEERKLDL